MSSQIQTVKEKLNAAITQLCETSWMFAKDPIRNFTRERKLPLREVISVLLCMEGGSLTGELLRYFGCSQNTASSSALVTSRGTTTAMSRLMLGYLAKCLYLGTAIAAATSGSISNSKM